MEIKRKNSRAKGKRGERFFVHKLKEIYPDIRRNANEQSQKGGNDLIVDSGSCFDFEVKCGESWNIKKIQGLLDQMKGQAHKGNYSVAMIKPDRLDPYVIMPFDDFYAILEVLRTEGVI